MSTKVTIETKHQIPAGLFSGIEAFWYQNEKWIIANGSMQRFHQAPAGVQQIVWKAFFADKESQVIIKKMGITKLTDTFDKWYKCVVGGLDHVPDFGKMLVPDDYNNMCADSDCAFRGKLCSRATGLKNYEVETLSLLKQGESIEKTASKLCVSMPGMKSRLEKIKIKLHATNMAALMARTSELGI